MQIFCFCLFLFVSYAYLLFLHDALYTYSQQLSTSSHNILSLTHQISCYEFGLKGFTTKELKIADVKHGLTKNECVPWIQFSIYGQDHLIIYVGWGL